MDMDYQELLMREQDPEVRAEQARKDAVLVLLSALQRIDHAGNYDAHLTLMHAIAYLLGKVMK